MPIDHVNALPPGTRFEEYRLDAVLGAGGFGITYRAYDANLDKFVAIKEYLPSEFATRSERFTVVPQSSTDAQDYHWGLNRFLDEARTLARFDYPHLNRVYRFFESNGTAYMVLEYVEGETLAGRLTRERQLPEESLQRLLDEVLSGLEVMHEAGYVHRDIKPGNLMLRKEDGSAVVLDFGAARQAVGQRSKAITSILTPGYAPIEQYDSKADDVGPWSDIYALGMVAYRCISGIGDSELPDAVTRGRTQRKGGVDLTPATEAGKGNYNPKLLESIDWAIEVDEEDRPQTVDAWRQALSGGGRRKSQAKSVRRTATKPAKGVTAKRTVMNWSGVTLSVVILALVGVSIWMESQLYPEWFGLGSGDILPVAQQEIPADMPGKTSQETEPGDTNDALAGTEETPLPEDTSQTGPVITAVESDEMVTRQPETESAKAPPTEEDEVTRLLDAAEDDLKARRLTSPAGNNAWDRYQQVLELQPTNEDAIKGMERVIESYMELFGSALEQEDFDKADTYLGRIRELHPDSPVLEEGAKRIGAAKQVLADRLAKEKAIGEYLTSFETALGLNDLDEAADILERIAALDASAPALPDGRQRLVEARRAEADRQAALERQRQTEIDRHTGLFGVAMQDGQLHKAAGHLAQIRAMDPDSPVLATAEQRLAEAGRQRTIKGHWESFEAALDEDNLDKATSMLSEIRKLKPDAPNLAAGEQRLADWRDALVRELAGEMMEIPGGMFRMGDLNGGGYDNERPVHNVSVSTFRLGKYEITVGQFRRFVQVTGYQTDAERNADGNQGCYTGEFMTRDSWGWTSGRSWRHLEYPISDDQPAVCISWNDARAYTQWLTEQAGETYRLPSEAEWEYAARAGSEATFHFGNAERQLCDYANVADKTKLPDDTNWQDEVKCHDGAVFPVKVGSYRPNEFGLHDMHGNVSEWVQDCWNDSYVEVPNDGRAWETGDCSRRVTRGGSWSSTTKSLRSASRGRDDSSSRSNSRGFRLAQDK